MKFIVKQIGGVLSTAHEHILDLTPKVLHQRVPVIFGSKNEVEVLQGYHKRQVIAAENNNGDQGRHCC